MSDRFDVFVGNLTFNTTEEQLREKFSFVGPVKNIRILVDKETGKPKGFAFIEYFDANTALSAIRHLDQTEMNSRKLKVGYPANSNLKDIARQIGQVVPDSSGDDRGTLTSSDSQAAKHQQEQNVIANLKLSDAWDILEAVKKLVTSKDQKAKSVLESHPQLINAVYDIQKRLGIQLPEKIIQQQQQAAIIAATINLAAPSRQPQQQSQQHGQSLREASAQHSRDYHQNPYQQNDNSNRGVGGSSRGGGNNQQSYNNDNSGSSGNSGRRSRFGQVDSNFSGNNNNTNNNNYGRDYDDRNDNYNNYNNNNNYNDNYSNYDQYNDQQYSNNNNNYQDNYYDDRNNWDQQDNNNNNNNNQQDYYENNDLAIDALLNGLN